MEKERTHSMKKIIIYGVSNIVLRRQIEYFLDDSYEIIGYSDGYYKKDFIDEKPFIAPENLWNKEFDFLLLNAFSESSRNQMKRMLEELGILSEKVIDPYILLDNGGAKNFPDLIADIDNQYHGEKNLIFGLSYSWWGINKQKLQRSFFDCSAPSIDLYYNYSLCCYMETRMPFINLQYVFFVFPYYYFDYDMSRSKKLYERGSMCRLWQLDDWHHYKEVTGAYEYVENYRMFGKKISQFYHVPKPSWQLPDKVHGDTDGTGLLNSVWFSNREETVVENRELFIRFYQKMAGGGAYPILIIPPWYVKGLNSVSREAFQKKKEKFYGILHEMEVKIGKITVFDYTDLLGQRDFFYDVEHLNDKGRKKFTEIINQEILQGKVENNRS